MRCTYEGCSANSVKQVAERTWLCDFHLKEFQKDISSLAKMMANMTNDDGTVLCKFCMKPFNSERKNTKERCLCYV